MVSDIRLFGLREASKGFLISMRASGGYSHRYIESMEMTLALFSNYAEEQRWPQAADITTEHVEQYLIYLQERPKWFGERGRPADRVSLSHIETQYGRLKTFFKWMVKRKHKAENPLAGITRPKPPQKIIRIIQDDDGRRLLKLLDPSLYQTPGFHFLAVRNLAAVLMLWDTPSRRDEVAQLTLDSINWDSGSIFVLGKGRKERIMTLGAAAMQPLWDYVQARQQLRPLHNYLWVDMWGKPMKASWLYLMLKRLGDRAGVPNLHTHRFRHTYTVSALRSGMPLPYLQREGGWAKIPQTYLNEISDEDIAAKHREISPADRLVGLRNSGNKRPRLGARGRL